MTPELGQRSYQEIVAHLLDLLEQGGRITDRRPGSVVRTLVEAFARELVETYARVGELYRHGFIDTAQGPALDQLVALLDVRRHSGSAAHGTAVFQRDPRLTGAITIAAGTELTAVAAATGKRATYRTAAAASIRGGRDEASVPIVADIGEDVADPAAILLDADDLADLDVILTTPLAGVRAVRIPEPTARRGRNESDDDLRARSKALLAAAGGGTAAALRRAVLTVPTVSSVELRDHADDPALRPGELEVVVDGDLEDPSVLAALERAVAEAKGPGIAIRLGAVRERLVRFTLHVLPEQSQLGLDQRQALMAAVEDRVSTRLAELTVGEGLVWNRLLADLVGIDGVFDCDLATSTLAVREPGASWQERSPGNIAGEKQSRLVLAPGSDGLRVVVGDEEPVAVRYAVTIDAPAPADRQAIERQLSEAFVAALATVATAEDPAARVLDHAALTDTLQTVLAGSGSIVAARYTYTEAASGLRAELAAGDAAIELGERQFPIADDRGPTITWGGGDA